MFLVQKDFCHSQASAVERGDVDDYYIVTSLRKAEEQCGPACLPHVLLRYPSYKSSPVLMKKHVYTASIMFVDSVCPS